MPTIRFSASRGSYSRYIDREHAPHPLGKGLMISLHVPDTVTLHPDHLAVALEEIRQRVIAQMRPDGTLIGGNVIHGVVGVTL